VHEVSIAQTLLATAERSAREAGLARVTRLRVELGPGAGVLPEALTQALDVVARGTVAAGARIEIGGAGAGATSDQPVAHDDASWPAAAARGAIRLAWIEGE
jgi:Zn finger protein HypA/HybF involved in hydrogenase expression